MKRSRNPALDYLVYLAVRLFVCVAMAMTVRASYRLADLLALALRRFDRRHRLAAIENLRHAYGADLDDAGRERIVRECYRHFCRMLMDMLHAPRKVDRARWRDRVRLVGQAPAVDRLLDGGPMILLSGHFGNWELAGYMFNLFGFPSTSVARTLDNPHLDRFLRSFRMRTGGALIAKKGGSDAMLDVVERGGVLSLLADQDAGPKGLFVDYFGRPASTYKAIGLLAITHRVPILIGGAIRVGDGFQYELICEELIEPSQWEGRPDDLRWLTQRYTTALERLVRRAPEQYLWLHRRWKHRPKERASKRTRVDGSGVESGPTDQRTPNFRSMPDSPILTENSGSPGL